MDPLDKVGGARAELALDARKFTRGIDQGISGLDKLESAGTRTGHNVGAAFGDISTKALIAGAAIAAGIGHAVKTFASFEKGMNAVRAVTGATGAEFDKLKAKALDIGSTTVFSATEATAAIEELAKAGQSVESILAGAADGAVALAAAAGESIAVAAAQIATTLNVFKLGGDQATHVADLFAAAASKTNASAAGIAEGMSNASAVFTLLGVPVEEAVGVLALFNDQAIMGAEAGTALKSSILGLLTPTTQQAAKMEELGIHLFDANGQFVGMAALAEQLQDSLGGLTEEERTLALAILGGSYGIRGLNVLFTAGAEVVDEFTDKVNDEGTAAEQAELRNAGFSGSMEELSSALETANIKLGEGLAPALKAVADSITAVVNGFAGLPPGLQKTIGFVAVGTAGFLLFVGAGVKAVMMIMGMSGSLRTLVTWLTTTTVAETAATGGATKMAAANTVATASATRLSMAARGLALSLGLVAKVAGAMIIADSVTKALEGPEAGPSTADDIAEGVEGKIGDAFNKIGANTFGNWLKGDAKETAGDQELFKILGDLGFDLNQSFMGGFLTKTSETTIEQLGGMSVQEIQKYADAAGISFEAAILEIADAAGFTNEQLDVLRETIKASTLELEAMKKLTPSGGAHGRFAGDDAGGGTAAENAALENEKRLAAAETERINLIAEGIAAAHEKTEQDEISTAVQEALNKEFQDGTDLLYPYLEGVENLEEAVTDFNESLLDQVQAVALANSGVVDLSTDLPGLQRGYAAVGESIYRALLNADKAGAIDLSSGEKSAFRLADALEKTEANIDRVSSAIANNQNDLSMWQSRIDLVDSVLGSNRDTLAEWQQQLAAGNVTQEEFNAAVADGRAVRAFDELNDLLDAGKISQEEYNEILSAGTWLRERSVGGIQDEQAEIAKLLPDLAEYVRQHDEDSRALDDLDPKQRARIAALQSENAQTMIQTALLVRLLVAMGQISEEQGTALLLDLTQFDPALQQALEDYGFFETTVTTPIEVPPVDVEVKLTGDGTGGPDESGIPSIKTPAADTSETEESLDISTAAHEKGTASGESFATGLDTGTDSAEQVASDAAGAVVSTLQSFDSSLFNTGFNNGWNWGSGELAGMRAMAPAIWEQAAAIAEGIDRSTRNAMDSHSPSRKGASVGADWDLGVAYGLRTSHTAETEARRASERIAWAARRGLSTSVADFGSAAQSSGQGNAASMAQPIIVQQKSSRGDLVYAPVFNGITDTEEILNIARTDVVDALTRWEAGQ